MLLATILYLPVTNRKKWSNVELGCNQGLVEVFIAFAEMGVY